jgi:hypothetical protein
MTPILHPTPLMLLVREIMRWEVWLFNAFAEKIHKRRESKSSCRISPKGNPSLAQAI